MSARQSSATNDAARARRAVDALSPRDLTRKKITVSTFWDDVDDGLAVRVSRGGKLSVVIIFSQMSSFYSPDEGTCVDHWQNIRDNIRRAGTASDEGVDIVVYEEKETPKSWSLSVSDGKATALCATDPGGIMAVTFSAGETADLLEMIDDVFEEWIAAASKCD